MLFAILALPCLSITPATGMQQQLLASNPDAADSFGVAVSICGNTAVVGAPFEAGSASGVDGDQDNSLLGSGAAYVFEKTATGWLESAYLKATPPNNSRTFGASVSIDGDTIVVGAPAISPLFVDSPGNAFVFVRQGSSWIYEAELSADNGDTADRFGNAVAISGDTIVVGAKYEDGAASGVNGNGSSNSETNSGAAYVFARTDNTWTQQAYLKAHDPNGLDLFGSAVEISGDTLAIGAPRKVVQSNSGLFLAGSVFIFQRIGTVWAQEAIVLPTPLLPADILFGSSLDLSGNTLAVGANGEDGGGTGINGNTDDQTAFQSGAAYVFVRSGTTWPQEAYIKASNAEAADQFGFSVSYSNDTLLVGANHENSNAESINGDQSDNSFSEAGAAYLFERNGTAWKQSAYLKSLPSDTKARFGAAAAIHDGNIIVGAPRHTFGSSRVGSAFAFEKAAILNGPPQIYCTPKLSSAGCQNLISSSDTSTQPVSGQSDYFVTMSQGQELKNGLLFSSITNASSLPFSGGGTLCAAPPLTRGPIANSGGSNPTGCNGKFSMLVNDGNIASGSLEDPGPGNTVWYQFWYRDPNGGPPSSQTALSNAIMLNFQ